MHCLSEVISFNIRFESNFTKTLINSNKNLSRDEQTIQHTWWNRTCVFRDCIAGRHVSSVYCPWVPSAYAVNAYTGWHQEVQQYRPSTPVRQKKRIWRIVRKHQGRGDPSQPVKSDETFVSTKDPDIVSPLQKTTKTDHSYSFRKVSLQLSRLCKCLESIHSEYYERLNRTIWRRRYGDDYLAPAIWR